MKNCLQPETVSARCIIAGERHRAAAAAAAAAAATTTTTTTRKKFTFQTQKVHEENGILLLYVGSKIKRDVVKIFKVLRIIIQFPTPSYINYGPIFFPVINVIALH